jgi:hypothetical protein
MLAQGETSKICPTTGAKLVWCSSRQWCPASAFDDGKKGCTRCNAKRHNGLRKNLSAKIEALENQINQLEMRAAAAEARAQAAERRAAEAVTAMQHMSTQLEAYQANGASHPDVDPGGRALAVDQPLAFGQPGPQPEPQPQPHLQPGPELCDRSEMFDTDGVPEANDFANNVLSFHLVIQGHGSFALEGKLDSTRDLMENCIDILNAAGTTPLLDTNGAPLPSVSRAPVGSCVCECMCECMCV